MKKFVSLFGIFLVFSPLLTFSQTLLDAYRLSSEKINGTARSAAMGNAFGALGGDFTSLSINPAGIAIYRSNEFEITPTARFNNSDLSLLNGASFSDNKYSQAFNSIGYVGTMKTGSSGESGIVSFNLGIGYNNILDLSQNSYGMMDGSTSSYLDGIVNYANQEALSNNYLNQNIGNIEYRDWPAKLAWDTYLMNPVKDANGNTVDGQYQSILYQNELVNQQINYSYKGGIKEYLLAGGMNFDDKLYLGATIGLRDVDMTKYKQYSENMTADNSSFTYYEDNYIKGSGYNLKFGLIYKPINSVRLGLAFHTPTFYKINDNMKLTMESQLQQTYSNYGRDLLDYRFNSPYKVVLSGAVVIEKIAIISVDGEMVDYSTMNYNNFNDLNSSIKDAFGNVFNFRMGGELRLTPNISARAGYEMYPNPYKSNYMAATDSKVGGDNSIYSFGLGYMGSGCFADLTFSNSVDKYNLYNPQPNFENLTLKNNNNQILFTLGFKF